MKITEMDAEQRKEMMERAAKTRELNDEAWQRREADFITGNPYKLKDFFLGVPKLYRRAWHACFTGEASLPRALKAKCMDCSGHQKDEVTNCTVRSCPLWQYRPYIKRG